MVVAFEDAPAEGEWLVLYSDGCGPLPFTNPNNIPKLRRIVVNAFARRSLNVGRAFDLSALPDLPRLGLLSLPANGFWLRDWKGRQWRGEGVTPCQLNFDLAATNEVEARELLLRAWSDPQSDARFAWDWARTSRDQKMASLCGYKGQWSELARVMRLVLLCASDIWQRGSAWNWSLHPQFAARGWLVNSSNRRDNSPDAHFAVWQELLFERFVPCFSTETLERHVSAREFWLHAETLQSVRLDTPPTMHERLEARLELRVWLQDKAAPSEIEKLLAL